LASSSVISTTRRCSSRVRVGFSPVVAAGDEEVDAALDLAAQETAQALLVEREVGPERVTNAVPHP